MRRPAPSGTIPGARRTDRHPRGVRTGELIEGLRRLAGMGVQTVIGVVPHLDQITPLEVIGREVIPAVADF